MATPWALSSLPTAADEEDPTAVFWGEGAEDGSRQGDHHGGRLDDDLGVLALPDTGLVAAVSQRGGSTGAAEVIAGHGCGVEGPWKRRCWMSRGSWGLV